MLEEGRKSVYVRWYIVRLTKFGPKFFLTLFLFIFIFLSFILETRIRCDITITMLQVT